MERANVAVARVSCICRGLRRQGGTTGDLCSGRVLRMFSVEIAIKHEKNRVSEHPQIRAPVETLARGLKIYAIDCLTRHAGKCAAADPEGFAHSAAAEGRRERRNGSAAKLVVAWTCRCGSSFVHVYAQMCPRLEPQQHLEARGGVCGKCRCASSLAHISDRTCYKTRGKASLSIWCVAWKGRMSLWLEFRAY